MPTNPHDPNQHGGHGPQNQDAPGYELTDVNVNGVVVFLSGLVGFLLVFFVFCFVMGKVINGQLIKADGPADKWHQAEAPGNSRQDLVSNPVIQQRQLQQVTSTFPEPRLEMDDGLQNTADLHAREDLFLEHYSSKAEGNRVRIPIERAMELVAQRGLPVNAHPTSEAPMVGDATPVVQAPLTDGFARTGYELDQIAAREQKMNFNRAEGTQAALTGEK